MAADSRDGGSIQSDKTPIKQLSDQVQQLTGMNQELMQLLLKLEERVTLSEKLISNMEGMHDTKRVRLDRLEEDVQWLKKINNADV